MWRILYNTQFKIMHQAFPLKLLIAFLSIPYLTHCEEASKKTISMNEAIVKQLPFEDKQDFEDASRGFTAPLPDQGIIKNHHGQIIWDLKNYQFLNTDNPSPKTVNPSLWRQGQLLYQSGLFKVTEGIYQVRGADLSNMTIIEGKEGIIVIDPLVSVETAKASLDLYYQSRPKKPIKAVMYTHSHVDHFGGVKGIITQEDVDNKKVRIYAPQGFVEASLDENMMAGNVMARRATYMYGNLLTPGPFGQVTSGLGLTSSSGTVSLILPTDYINKTGETKVIDGVEFSFIFAPGAEAPAEMIFFLPEFKALGIAEEASHTMHNVYSLRGAKPRDAKAWSKYLKQALELFGAKSEVIFGQHHWPKWGQERVIDYLTKQRDLYKYIHDQTLRLANQGYTMLEIGEMIKLPDSLAKAWYNRGYYGSLNQNAKAVYDFYLGWFDGNPSNLHPLPPVPASKKYIEYMGGSEKVLERARQDFVNGEFRWIAQVLNHLVFAEPDNRGARDLLANTLEQLGYQSENATWRNFYLTGAKELREGVKQLPAPEAGSLDLMNAIPNEQLFEYLAIKLDGPKAANHSMVIHLVLTEKNEKFTLQITNGVLNYFNGFRQNEADAVITLNRSDLINLTIGKTTLGELEKENKIKIEGSKKSLETFLSLFDQFNFWFNIVEPQR